MNKINFLKNFENEDEFLIANLWNDINLVLEINFPVYSEVFFSTNIWKKLSLIMPFFDLSIECFGLTNLSDKKLIVIYPKNFNRNSFIPDIVYFKIDAKNRFKTLEHKDFLGAITSLGLKRELFGDIIVEENCGFCVSTKKIYDIISQSLTKINTIPVKLREIEVSEIPSPKFKEFHKNISSLRLDNIVSAITNLARSNAVNLIGQGEVLINYKIEKSKNKLIELNTIITIRKKGKFLLKEIIGETKKERLKVIFMEYI